MNVHLLDLKHAVQVQTIAFLSHYNVEQLGSDALSLSLDYGMDRANVSRMLNQLWRKGELIKIQGRPTYFLDVAIVKERYRNGSLLQSYTSVESLLQLLNEQLPRQKPEYYFDEHIGSRIQESLYEQSQRIRNYLHYPSSFFHFTLVGQTGSGKLRYCDEIFRCAASMEHFGNDLVFQMIRCDLLDEMSWTEQVQVLLKEPYLMNFIVFHRVDLLSAMQQRYLLNAMEVMIREGKEAVVIFTSHHKPHYRPSFYSEPLRMPPFDQRSSKEKLSFTLSFFEAESRRINIPILIQKNILNCFMTSVYDNNIYELQHEIQSACVRAYTRMHHEKEPLLRIAFDDLSDRLLNEIHDVETRVHDLNAMYDALGKTRFYVYPERSSETLQRLKTLVWEPSYRMIDRVDIDPYVKMDSLERICKKDLRKALGMLPMHDASVPMKTMQTLLQPLFRNTVYEQHPSLIDMLIGHILDVIEHEHSFVKTDLDSQYFDFGEKAVSLADAIESTVIQTFKIAYPAAESMYLKAYLHYGEQLLESSRIQAIYLCHWENLQPVYKAYLDASSEMLKPHVFAISLQDLESMPHQNLDHLIKAIEASNEGKGVVLLSDARFSEDLMQSIRLEATCQVEFVSHVYKDMLDEVIVMLNDPFIQLYHFAHKMNGSVYLSGFATQQLETMLSVSLSFLDVRKLVANLMKSYSYIVNTLHYPYHEEQATRFILEAAFAIEQGLKNEVKRYPRLNQNLRRYTDIFKAVSYGMDLLSHEMDVSLSADALMYLSELFIDTSETNS